MPQKSQLSFGWQSYSVRESLKLMSSLWDSRDKNTLAFCVKTIVMEDSFTGFSSSPSVPPLMLVWGFFGLFFSFLSPYSVWLSGTAFWSSISLLPENRKIILLPLGEGVGSEKNYITMTYIKKIIKKKLVWERTMNIYLLSCKDRISCLYGRLPYDLYAI